MIGKCSKYRRPIILLLGLFIGAAGPNPQALAEELPAARQEESAARQEESAARQAPFTVRYQELETLVRQGNPEISQMLRSQEEALADYQEMWDILKWEQLSMEQEAKERKDEKLENAALYESNAQSLKLSARAVTRIMENMTGERASRSTEKLVQAKTLAVKSLMNSYCQLDLEAKASAMRAEAAKAQHESAQRQLSLGMVSQGEAGEARDQMNHAADEALKARQQAEQMKGSLLNALGLRSQEQVEVEALPAPDLSLIDGINAEEDLRHAIGNSQEVLNARHQKASGTSQKQQRSKESAQAEGNAQADFEASLGALKAARTEFEGAKASYESSRLAYESLKRQQQAGLLSSIQWLEGQAAALEGEADFGQASMNLVQAYENYQGLVKGLTAL